MDVILSFCKVLVLVNTLVKYKRSVTSQSGVTPRVVHGNDVFSSSFNVS